MATPKTTEIATVEVTQDKPLYKMLVNWRHGAFYPVNTVSDLASVPIELIDSAIEAGYMEKI
jgi:hypothetical protein